MSKQILRFRVTKASDKIKIHTERDTHTHRDRDSKRDPVNCVFAYKSYQVGEERVTDRERESQRQRRF